MKYTVGVKSYVIIEADSESEAMHLALNDEYCDNEYEPYEVFYCERYDGA